MKSGTREQWLRDLREAQWAREHASSKPAKPANLTVTELRDAVTEMPVTNSVTRRGRKPLGEATLSQAERARLYRQRKKEQRT